jgi:hypothetical protein
VDDLDHIGRPDAVTVRVDGSGTDPTVVLLVIAFAPAGNRVLKDLWATAILPRIRRRWGEDAIGPAVGRAGQARHADQVGQVGHADQTGHADQVGR